MSCATYYQSASCRKADCVTQSGRRRRPLLRCRSVQASQESSAEGMAAASHNLGHNGCRMVAVSMIMKPSSWKITSQPEAPREMHLCCMTDRRFYTWIQRRLLITTWYLSGLENTSASAQLHRYQKRSGAGHQVAIADASHGAVFQEVLGCVITGRRSTIEWGSACKDKTGILGQFPFVNLMMTEPDARCPFRRKSVDR